MKGRRSSGRDGSPTLVKSSRSEVSYAHSRTANHSTGSPRAWAMNTSENSRDPAAKSEARNCGETSMITARARAKLVATTSCGGAPSSEAALSQVPRWLPSRWVLRCWRR